MAYLIKATIIWAVFLVLFELCYKNNTRFLANRIYLLLSLTLGLLIPLISLPAGMSWQPGTLADLPMVTQQVPVIVAASASKAVAITAMPAAAPVGRDWNVALLIGILYGAGALVLLLKYLLELYKIAVLLRKNEVRMLYGHQVISTGKIHSPYSFMSYTFLTDADVLQSHELQYIIQHESAHHSRKHWLDLWLLQLISIIFWFHPLVWRYRYLLQLQHEYEADAIAAVHDPYAYGRFILQQTLLRGVPAITHSFHFSPIKNRIYMLTKINGSGSDNRKYLLLLPALVACTFLMGKSNAERLPEIPGNKMSYKGDILTWRQSDTLFYDKDKGQAELVPANAKIKPRVIVGINDEPVYNNDHLQAQASYGHASTAFADYVKEEFQKLRKHTADSMTYLVDLSVVVDKGGKVIYYDAHYAKPQDASTQPWDLFYHWDTQANVLLDKIIADSPRWKPALQNGEPVNSYVNLRFPGC